MLRKFNFYQSTRRISSQTLVNLQTKSEIMGKSRYLPLPIWNTKPFLFGLQHSSILDSVELSLDVPSVCADKLKTGTVDIGIIPVTEIS